MLYLIRSFGRGGKSYLKIGFSDSIDNRMGQYKMHNPLFETIAQRPGSLYDEAILHMYLEAMGYKAKFLNEWFTDCSEVLTLFHEDLTIKAPRMVWKCRDSLFTISDFSNPLKREIFEKLRQRWSNGSIKYNLDREWRFAESKEKLKKIKKSLDDFPEWY